ncbi:iron chelate uptake ABC transporter family permease subunit [Candidatus Kapaibacterium sp.]
MEDIIKLLLTDYTLRNVAIGASILGLVSGSLGTFAFLRKESLMGDVVAHSSLLGITLIFILTYLLTGMGLKNEPMLMLGAVISGIIAMIFVSKITSDSRIKSDSAMGIILAIFFGGGMFLLTMIQQSNIENKAGLSSYLFGSAATISHQNVWMMSVLGFMAVLLMFIFWKEFKVHTFDPDFGETIGVNRKNTNLLIISVIVIAIVIGLQAVGVILMVALIVAPPSAARQWTNNLKIMTIISAIIGLVSGLIGAIASSLVSNLPTGPTIVLVATFIFIISVLFSPKRGIISELIRKYKDKRRILISLALSDMYYLEMNHDDRMSFGHSSKVIDKMNPINYNIQKSLTIMKSEGLVNEVAKDNWKLTDKGIDRAKMIQQEKGN